MASEFYTKPGVHGALYMYQIRYLDEGNKGIEQGLAWGYDSHDALEHFCFGFPGGLRRFPLEWRLVGPDLPINWHKV